MQVAKDRAIVSFNPEQTQLVIKGKQLLGFSIAGQDKKFYWANGALTSNNTVTVWSSKVPLPVAVRYNWADNPEGNLYNSRDFPVAPFRTDPWALPPVMSRYNFVKYLLNPEL
jgi:sialate O-acetylesterase